MNIRGIRDDESHAVAEIYNHFVLTSDATFEMGIVNTAEMQRRIQQILNRGYPFLVCELDGEIAGYAYADRYKEREAYRASVELSVYVGSSFKDLGIGTALYEVLIPLLASQKCHALMAGISLPNDASVKLHEKFGFKKVAHFSEVGRKFDRWIDVGYWELLI